MMTNEYDDDLLPPDPRFPDRPHTLDLARLSSALGEQDAIADMLGIRAAMSVDHNSLAYLAKQRVEMGLIAGAKVGLSPDLILQSIYFDAFHLGVGFQKRGGHRPTETGTAGEGSSS